MKTRVAVAERSSARAVAVAELAAADRPGSAPRPTSKDRVQVERAIARKPREAPPAIEAAPAVPDVALVREHTRGRIALALTGVLALVVLLPVLALLFGQLSVHDVKELFDSLGLLTTLVGTAMGYYFGRAKR